jgi:hypothetical protein
VQKENATIEFNLKFLNNKKREKNLPQGTGAGQHTATRQGAQNLQLFMNNDGVNGIKSMTVKRTLDHSMQPGEV